MSSKGGITGNGCEFVGEIEFACIEDYSSRLSDSLIGDIFGANSS